MTVEFNTGFVAEGPLRTGFETQAANLVYGVNVQGTRCGVYGESVSVAVRDSDIDGVGVSGTGDTVGVYGQGSHGRMGVLGTQTNGSVGVIGAVMRGGNGVVGLSLGSLGNPADLVPLPTADGSGTGVLGKSGSGHGVLGQSTSSRGVGGISESDIGVFGISTLNEGVHGQTSSDAHGGVVGVNTGSGAGVFGVSSKSDGVVGQSNVDRKSGVVGFNPEGSGFSFGVFGNCPSGIGVGGRTEKFLGVHGVCGNADPSNPGVGVKGDNGDNGIGVEGTSVNGIGGSFSGGHAPLRLIPGAIVGAPTTGNHQRGELFVDSNGDLFYCREDGTPGNWFRVQLAPGAAGFSSEVEGVSPVVPQPSPPAPAGTGRSVHARLGAHEQILTALSFSVVEGTIDSENQFTGKPEVAPKVGNLELIYGYVVPGWWGLYWDRLNGSPLRISTREAEPDVGEAQIWCELGIFLGSTMVHVAASGSTATVPPSRPGRKAGDIEFNSDPQAGGHVGWVWVVPSGSTAGSWKQFGNIEP